MEAFHAELTEFYIDYMGWPNQAFRLKINTKDLKGYG